MTVSPRIRRPGSCARQQLSTVAVAAFLAVFAALGATGPGRAADHTIQARNYEYVVPGGGSTLTVTAGDQVTWVVAQASDPHTVTSGSPGAADDRFVDRPASAGLLLAGDTFTTTFASPGTYPYFCEVHPEQMLGTVVVVAASSQTPAPTPAATPRPTPAATPPATTPGVAPSATPTPIGVATPAVTATPIASPPTTPAPSTPPSEAGSPAPSGSGGAAGGPEGITGGGSDAGALPIVLAVMVGTAVAGAIGVAIRRHSDRRSGRRD